MYCCPKPEHTVYKQRGPHYVSLPFLVLQPDSKLGLLLSDTLSKSYLHLAIGALKYEQSVHGEDLTT